MWNATLSHSDMETDPQGSVIDQDVNQIQILEGYSFDFGLEVDLGYEFEEDEGVDSHVFGVILHKAFHFSIPAMK